MNALLVNKQGIFYLIKTVLLPLRNNIRYFADDLKAVIKILYHE